MLSDLYKKLSKFFDSDFDIKNTDTIAGQERMVSRRDFILRFLWLIGLRAKMENSEDVEIDSVTLNKFRKKLKLPTNEDGWKSAFSLLKPLGIKGSLEILTDRLYTPGGWMREIVPGTREAAYRVHFSFGKKLGGLDFFKSLKQYTEALDKKYGNRSFSRFSRLDFDVLA